MFVVGTAGHVDHGKSTLVYRLTGMDPDRLAEEKRRGLTIDLGFAWLTLPDGRELSIVDVPGHERFVRNMLAGVGGLDVAMLVVAADEGVMPQTREHLAIIDLLQIRRGLVVLTKRDLVDADWLELVADDVRQELAGTALASAPLVAVSAVSGEGLDDLIATLAALLDEIEPRRPDGQPRLPIDRVFTLSGHGTVVTGTLLDGSLRAGDEVEVLPEGLRSRLRSLQTHRQRVDQAGPGSRVAANLVGLTVEQVRRGDILCRAGAFHPTTTIDVSLRLLAVAGRPLESGDAVMLYSGAAEIPATIRLLADDALAPEAIGPAQLRLAQPTVVRRGDRFILRRPSPAETIGGGEVLDPQARRVRRGRLGPVLGSELDERTLLAEVLGTRRLWALADLAARLQQPPAQVAAGLAALHADGLAVTAGEVASAPEAWRGLTEVARQALGAYHAAQSLRQGMPREELRDRLGVPPALWSAVVGRLAAAGVLAEDGAVVRLPSFQARLAPAQEQRARQVLDALAAGGAGPPALDELIGGESGDAALLAYLSEHGELVRLNEQVAYPRETYRELVSRVVTALEGGPQTVAQVRDLLGVSRRYALALLEYLDLQRVTRRTGDSRVLLHQPDWLSGRRQAS